MCTALRHNNLHANKTRSSEHADQPDQTLFFSWQELARGMERSRSGRNTPFGGGGDGVEREGQENTCLFSPNSIIGIVKVHRSESQCTIELRVYLMLVFLPALTNQTPAS